MRQFTLLVINFLLYVSLTGCSSSINSSENCATKVVLFWDNTTTLLEKKKILNEAFFINVHKDKNNIPIGEMGTFNNYSWIYFIYSSNQKQCQEKVKYTHLILEQYFSIVQNSPKYKIIGDISDKELNIIQHQDKYNEKDELEKWLDYETKRQLKI